MSGFNQNFLRCTLQVNYACNQRCLHCFQDAGPHLIDVDLKRSDRLFEIVGRLREFGFEEVKIVGGEPMLYSNLLTLLERCKEVGLSTGLVTGGSAGSRDLWNRLGDNLDRIWFSIYHVKNDVHDKLVQKRGALDALWANLEIVAHHHTICGAHVLLNRWLLDDLEPFLEALCAKSFEEIKILWPSPDGAAIRNWAEYAIPNEDRIKIRSAVIAARKVYPEMRIKLARHALEQNELHGDSLQGRHLVCSYGEEKLWGVDPEGILYPCCLLTGKEPYALGHVLEVSPQEIIERLAALANRDKNCGIGPSSGCGRCPALLNQYGQDRREGAGWTVVCPLAQESL